MKCRMRKSGIGSRSFCALKKEGKKGRKAIISETVMVAIYMDGKSWSNQ